MSSRLWAGWLRWPAPAATAIVYFSGHGMETPNYYLMPFGYNVTDLTGTAIAGEEFTACLRAIQAKKLLVTIGLLPCGGPSRGEGTGEITSPFVGH